MHVQPISQTSNTSTRSSITDHTSKIWVLSCFICPFILSSCTAYSEGLCQLFVSDHQQTVSFKSSLILEESVCVVCQPNVGLNIIDTCNPWHVQLGGPRIIWVLSHDHFIFLCTVQHLWLIEECHLIAMFPFLKGKSCWKPHSWRLCYHNQCIFYSSMLSKHTRCNMQTLSKQLITFIRMQN